MLFQLIGDATITAFAATSISWNAGISSCWFRHGYVQAESRML